jgi:hypothetical protein
VLAERQVERRLGGERWDPLVNEQSELENQWKSSFWSGKAT